MAAVTGVTTIKTSFLAAKIVNCAGAWSGQDRPTSLSHSARQRPDALPGRCRRAGLLKHVIRTPEAYLIPRSDGRLLVGATVEEAGFDKRTDPATIQRLHRAALKLVPKLADAKILEDWAGLRPGTPDNLPDSGRDRHSWLLRRHRPLSRRHLARTDYGPSHGRRDRGPQARVRPGPLLTSKGFSSRNFCQMLYVPPLP